MKYFFLTFIALFIFSGCVHVNPPKPLQQESKKPYWVKDETILPNNLAVGFCKPVFGGVYAQRQNALLDAKEKLSHKINAIISSNKTENLNMFHDEVSIDSVQNIKSLSKVVLNNIKVYDTYINSSKELYILIGLADAKVTLEPKITKAFNRKDLEASTCYNKKILKNIDTASKIYNGKPLWFYTQAEDNAIGIAQKVDGNFEMQKKTAIFLAKTNLVKKVKSHSISKIKMMQMLKHNETATILDTKSIHQSKQKLKNILLKDIWMDPKSCELYVLVAKSAKLPISR